MDDQTQNHELDLPLMSNVNDFHVKHYILDLVCNMEGKTFQGTLTLFIEPVTRSENVIKRTQKECSQSNINIAQTRDTSKLVPDDKTVALIKTDAKRNFNEISTTVECDGEENVKYLKLNETNLERNVDSNATIKSDTEMASSLNHEMTFNRANVKSISYNINAEMMHLTEPITDVNSQDASSYHSDTRTSMNEPERNPKILPKEVIASFDKDHLNTPEGYSYSVCDKLNEADDTHDLHSSDVDVTCKAFTMVLDAWDLTVHSAQEVLLCTDGLNLENVLQLKHTDLYQRLAEAGTEPLDFTSDKKSLKIWKAGVGCRENFPCIVRICYNTSPNGPSLKWTSDQDGKPCVYTHGHWINNRSLFPSQDAPSAMATWRAYICARQDLTVLMSGDHDADVLFQPGNRQDGYCTHYYYTLMKMPSSTLSLAIGHWVQVDVAKQQDRFVEPSCDDGGLLPWRIFTPRILYDKSKHHIGQYMPRCMKAAHKILGTHPFLRLDILIVPCSFGSLGMASPSLMFISQSVISTDQGMLVRLSHEISHSWFGLLIGPCDWTEEWLSEGFCTYTEGLIHAQAMGWNATESRCQRAIQDYLKYKTLQAEVATTTQDLQILRQVKDPQDGEGVQYVKNGMNPDKCFMQVHYLKGYFLLRHLECIVGTEAFCEFICLFVEQFHHQLVTSQDVLTSLFKTFPYLENQGLTEELIMKEWLDNPGLPPNKLSNLLILETHLRNNYYLHQCLSNELNIVQHTMTVLHEALGWLHQIPTIPTPKEVNADASLEDNQLAASVIKLVKQLKEFNQMYMKLHWRKKRKLDVNCTIGSPKLNNVQVLLLLDMLLKIDKIHSDVLLSLHSSLKLSQSNADVLHRWCELVIKNKIEVHYQDVRDFLVDHQAMGVYLFGELILSNDKTQRKLAETCFNATKIDMEEGTLGVVRSMIYGK